MVESFDSKTEPYYAVSKLEFPAPNRQFHRAMTRSKLFLRVVCPDSSFEISFGGFSALEHAYAFKIRV